MTTMKNGTKTDSFQGISRKFKVSLEKQFASCFPLKREFFKVLSLAMSCFVPPWSL